MLSRTKKRKSGTNTVDVSIWKIKAGAMLFNKDFILIRNHVTAFTQVCFERGRDTGQMQIKK